MDKFFKQQLYIWVYDKIKSNPKKFGGDNSSALIMYEYLTQFYHNVQVGKIEPYVMSVLSSVCRIKNKILETNPHFDMRIKHKPKKTKKRA